MIYCTTSDRIEDTSKLYSEWFGHTPQLKGVQINACLIVAKDDSTEEVVGAAQLLIHDDPVWGRRYGFVENLYVSKAYRRRGIGKELMRHTMSQAAIMGCKFVKLTAGFYNREAIALFTSLGFNRGYSFGKSVKVGEMGEAPLKYSKVQV